MTTSLDTFKCRRTLTVGEASYDYFSLPEAEKNGLAGISSLPFSLKVLLENLLRHEDGKTVTADDIRAMSGWLDSRTSTQEIAFRPARVLMQDFTGVPGGGRSGRHARRDGRPRRYGIEDQPADPGRSGHRPFGHGRSFRRSGRLSPECGNGVWPQRRALFVPALGPGRRSTISALSRREPESAIRSIWSIWPGPCGAPNKTAFSLPIPTLWSAPTATPPWSTAWPCSAGASAASRRRPPLLGQPISMLIPEVIGFRLSGRLGEGVTATDLVLTVTEQLRPARRGRQVRRILR